MDKEQIQTVLIRYLNDLDFVNVFPKRHSLDEKVHYSPIAGNVLLEHAAWMCNETLYKLENFDENRDKIMRWLGFIQATLWAAGFYTIEKMKNDNR